MDIYKQLGTNIRKARINLGLTQGNLAELSGISSNFISQIERGKDKASLETVYKISIAMQIPLHHLILFKTDKVSSKRKELLVIESMLTRLPDNFLKYISKQIKSNISNLKDLLNDKKDD